MRISTPLVVTALLCALVLTSPVPANAQGCTLGLPNSIENALNSLLLGACNRHDACWRTLNPCGGPYLGLGWKAQCDLAFLADLTAVCVAATAIISFPNSHFPDADEFLEDCETGAAAAYAGVSAAIPIWWGSQCAFGCNANTCASLGAPLPSYCCPAFPPCECWSDQDCDYLPPPSEWGTWECLGCMCIPTNSPLVLHLPDYLPIKAAGGDWWRQGFCGPEAPTVCLDWRDEGNLTCTGWTAPETDVAFLVTLNEEDTLFLAVGQSVRAEPWRHMFGNVTKGSAGDFPYAHGFEALAAFCGQDPDDGVALDLGECGERLYAWVDRSADGRIEAAELVEFSRLGISSLGNVRATDKMDKCGNTFPAESHALCAGRKCGTWLDVFFESRPLPAP